MMKLMEIKELSVDEISNQLKKSQIELVELKMKFTSRQLEDLSQIKKKRKEIARLHTIKTIKSKDVNIEPKIEKVKKVKTIKTKKAAVETASVVEKPKRKTSKTKGELK